jgi:hypothetical protein
MTIPERTPLAVDHGLNSKRIDALLELYREGTTDAHHATLVSLRDKGMVKFHDEGTSQPYLTLHGKEVAQGLDELDDQEESGEDAEPAEIGTKAHEFIEEFACPKEAEFVEDLEPEDLTLAYAEAVSGAAHHRIQLPDSAAVFDGSAGLLAATFQVICRGRRSGEHSQLIAVVVGDESDAQRVADQWNLAHLADIADRAGATYATVQPAEVGVYLFERFAVVQHP